MLEEVVTKADFKGTEWSPLLFCLGEIRKITSTQ